MKRVREKSLVRATVKFYDPDWVAIIPNTARYRIDCETNCQTVLDWTTLTPAASMQIVISAAYNAIINCRNKQEIKVLTVEVNTDTTTMMHERARYQVDNLQGVR
jgi:hypothetical protein